MASNGPDAGAAGEGFAHGDIARQHLPGCGGESRNFPPGDCCWAVVATTACTVFNERTNQSCCWIIMSTTECTIMAGGEPCCWAVVATTACTYGERRG